MANKKVKLLLITIAAMLFAPITFSSYDNFNKKLIKDRWPTINIAEPLNHQSIWPRINHNLQLDIYDNPEVVKYIDKYKNDNHHLKVLTKRAAPYLYHIVSEVEERQMPGEIALLPLIESGFLPQAVSGKGAAGIWQIMPASGERFGLTKDYWYDGRKDVKESTKAALDYLQFLAKEFDNDWLLVVAAYNSGEGRVKQAINKNKKLGKPTDYWSLHLPNQTKHYVPRLLALAEIIKNADIYDTPLAEIQNKPYFRTISFDKQIDLLKSSKLANLSFHDMISLNAGYRRAMTHPNGPHKIILPIENAKIFEKRLKERSFKAIAAVKKRYHIIEKGDSIIKIAKKYNVSANAIKLANNLKHDIIVLGKKLHIPHI